MKDITKTKDDAQKILDELQSFSELYVSIISPTNYPWRSDENRVKKSLEALKYFNVKQQLPMVLALLRAYKQKKIRLKRLSDLLAKIEFFHFVFNAVTSQRSSGSISTHYSKHAILLNQAEDNSEIQLAINSLLDGLNRKSPTYSEFESSFIELNYTKRRSKSKIVIQYSLRKLLGDASNGLAVDYDGMSIEHILSEDRIKNEQNEEEVGNIGNLLLIDKKTNNEELSNLDFVDKKNILITRQYPVDEVLLKSTSWGKQEIRARAKFLAQSIWDRK